MGAGGGVTPTVSVIIPVYNGLPLVEQTVAAVLDQHLRDLELIVVDDGSADGSAERLERLLGHDSRARVERYDNAGVTVARNRGIGVARGRYVAFVDQDDLWYPEKLTKQVALLDARPDVALVGCFMDYMSASGRKLGRTAQTPDPIDQEAMRRGHLVPFNISGALFRARAVEGGVVDYFGPGLATTSDLQLLAKGAAAGEVQCIRESLGAYRIHRSSVIAGSHRTQLAALRYLQETISDPTLASRLSWPDFEASYRPDFQMRRYQFVTMHYRRAGLEALERHWVTAASHLVLAVAAQPRFALGRLSQQLRGR